MIIHGCYIAQTCIYSLRMISPVSLFDVAKAAGVSPSTVSRVICGKATGNRICPTTQNRVLAVAHQLGYQPNQIARNIVLGRGRPLRSVSDDKSKMEDKRPDWPQIGLILSAASSPETLGIIPGLIPELAAAGYRLVVITTDPTDPSTAREQVIQFLGEGVAGLLCCPTVYSSVLATGASPVIVLWQGAGKAITRAIRGPSAYEQATISENHNTSPQQSPAQPVPPLQPKPTPVAPVAGPMPVIKAPTEEKLPPALTPVITPILPTILAKTDFDETRESAPSEPVVVTVPKPKPAPATMHVPIATVEQTSTPIPPSANQHLDNSTVVSPPPETAPAVVITATPVTEPPIHESRPETPTPVPVVDEPEVISPTPATVVVPEPNIAVEPVMPDHIPEPPPPVVVTTPPAPESPTPEMQPATPVSAPVIDEPVTETPTPVLAGVPEPAITVEPVMPDPIPEPPPSVVITTPSATEPQTPEPQPATPVSAPVIDTPATVTPTPVPAVVPEPAITVEPVMPEPIPEPPPPVVVTTPPATEPPPPEPQPETLESVPAMEEPAAVTATPEPVTVPESQTNQA